MSQNIISTIELDDRHPNITYAGAEWTVHENVEESFRLFNDTDTFTDVQGATATLRFYGNAVEYWGNQGPYHGNCLVTIDGQDLATANSHAPQDAEPIMLFSTNQLELRDHTLVIRVLDPSYPAVCEVDRFVVRVTSNPTTTGLRTSTGLYQPTPSEIIAEQDEGGDTSSSPPIAAIAGGVGGAVVLCLLLVGFWLYKRSKNKKANGGVIAPTKTKLGKPAAAVLAGGPPSPAPAKEKHDFHAPQTYPNQPSSYVSSSPPPSSYQPSSPAPSTAAFNPHLLAYNPGTLSPPPSSTGGMTMPNSPQQTVRPMSMVSSTSGAPTMSYYTPTAEGGFPGYHNQPPQQQYQQPQQPYQPPQQLYQQPEQQQYQQQPPFGVAPVWATPVPTSSPPPMHVQQLSAPSPSQSPAPIVSHPSPSASPAPTTNYPQEKAQYMPRPEKASFTGAYGESPAGASGSSAPAPTATAGTSGSGQNAQSQGIMTPPVPDLPPPAYQF